MKKSILITTIAVGLAVWLSSCTTTYHRHYYFGYSPKQQEQKTTMVTEESSWRNPLSDTAIYEENTEKTQKNVQVIERYVYYRPDIVYIPVVMPWWDYYWYYPYYARFGIYIGYRPLFWWDYWYNPWYDFHPYYGYSWAYYSHYWYWRDWYWHKHHWYWSDYKRYPRKNVYVEYKDRNFGPTRGSVDEYNSSKGEWKQNRTGTNTNNISKNVDLDSPFKSRAEKFIPENNQTNRPANRISSKSNNVAINDKSAIPVGNETIKSEELFKNDMEIPALNRFNPKGDNKLNTPKGEPTGNNDLFKKPASELDLNSFKPSNRTDLNPRNTQTEPSTNREANTNIFIPKPSSSSSNYDNVKSDDYRSRSNRSSDNNSSISRPPSTSSSPSIQSSSPNRSSSSSSGESRSSRSSSSSQSEESSSSRSNRGR